MTWAYGEECLEKPRQFRLQANRLKKQIVAAANHSARHPAIQKIQDLFREKTERLFHWTRAPTLPLITPL